MATSTSTTPTSSSSRISAGAARSAWTSTACSASAAARRRGCSAQHDAQLRLLRRAGRHDLHHRPPAQQGQLARLRHVPAEHHGGGARQGLAHLPAGGVRAVTTDRSGRSSGIPDEEIVVCGMSLGYEDTAAPENALGPSACRRAISRAFAAGREGESDAGAQSRIVGPSGLARRSRLQQFRRPDRPRGAPARSSTRRSTSASRSSTPPTSTASAAARRRFLGEILGERRKDIVLATKFGMPMDDAGRDEGRLARATS